MSTRHSARQTTLIVFARVPRLGEVKTRLAATMGAPAALEIYCELLLHTLATAASAVGYQRRVLMLADDDPHAVCTGWAERFGFVIDIQHGADLGERMQRAIDTTCIAGHRAVLIGSDCPAMRPGDLEDAHAALCTADSVVAPAEDGGYVLIGCARPGLPLFERIDWGSPRVFEQTLARAQTHSITVARLRTLWDVDTIEDWQRWQASRPRGSTS